MFLPPRKLAPLGLLGALILGLVGGQSPAQPPEQFAAAQPAQPGQPADDGTEVLARGPVHEAFAATVEQPTPGPVVPKQPPEAIEELPPDQKPEGDNVLWIPGYWSWDEERNDFIWISGFWRAAPPNRVWVPGSWHEVQGGWQWTSGFWQDTTPVQPGTPQPAQPEIEYLPQPPATIEVGPAVPAPTVTSLYVPGTWLWRGRYVWRPGFWIEYRPGWVWVPAHFRWTPVGYVFVDGYWDYPLARRGVLFAPVYFAPRVIARPVFVYTPAYVVSEPCMVGALFVRRGYGNYYFGDYFEARYVTAGYTSFTGVSVGVVVGGGRRYHYDPLWSYYSVTYRDTPRWNAGVTELYVGRYKGTVPPPPRTLVQQNTTIQNITNVTNVTNITNNITVDNSRTVSVNNKDVTHVAMVAPLAAAPKLQPEARVVPVAADVRAADARAAKEIREVAVQRRKTEADMVAKGAVAIHPGAPKIDPKDPNPPKIDPKAAPPAQPVKARLDVPRAAVEKAQVKEEKHQPPPPAKIDRPGVGAKTDPTDPKVGPKVEPKAITPPTPPPVNPPGTPVNPMPKVDPKVDPKTPGLPVNPMPKVDPKGKVDPLPDPKGKDPVPKGKVDPVPEPKGKVDPKGPPVNPPKAEPLPVPPMPKVEPKGPPTNPGPPAKVEPPKVEPKMPPVNPTPPVTPPKVEPKGPPTNPGPPPVNPGPPAAPPKVNPPAPMPPANPLPPAPMPPPKVNPPVTPPPANPGPPPMNPNPVPPPRPPGTVPPPPPPVMPPANPGPPPGNPGKGDPPGKKKDDHKPGGQPR